jgi:archaellum component FlaC
MNLNLTSLRQEMKESFGEVHDRIDRILLRLDGQIKESDWHSRQIDERFEQIDRRFEQVDRRFSKLTSDIVEALSPYFASVDIMLKNHDERISALEQESV